jgi:cytochrome c-type biogenesis protein CcmH
MPIIPQEDRVNNPFADLKLANKLWLQSLLMTLFLFAVPSVAITDILEFKSPEQEQLYRELTAELRCPKCQNQNIADSNAVVAVDMRHKTLQLVEQGMDKAQVIDYMKTRYGDFVHYQPPFRFSTIWLWLLPVLLVIALAFVMLKKQRQQTITQNADDAELQAMIDAVRKKQP